MNKIINFFSKKNKTNKIKFNIFKRDKKITSNVSGVIQLNSLNDYSFTENSLSNSSSSFTISTQASSDHSLLNKSQFYVQDSTFESATIEEMYTDNVNILANSCKLIGFSNDSFQININQSSWTFESIQSLDSIIRTKLSELKSKARQLNIQLPAHITMLETVYNLRINNLQRDYITNQKKLEEKRQVNKLVKHILNASRLIKNHTSYWSKSIDLNSKSNTKYDELECQIRKKIDSIQNEILQTICEMEIRFKKEQNQQQLIKYFNKKQKVNYLTELSMQKRIRMNKKRLHKSVIVTSTSGLNSKSKNNKNINVSFSNF